jgi:hypothetical protein
MSLIICAMPKGREMMPTMRSSRGTADDRHWAQLGTCPPPDGVASRRIVERNRSTPAGTAVAHVISVATESHVAARVADQGDSNEEQDSDEFLT